MKAAASKEIGLTAIAAALMKAGAKVFMAGATFIIVYKALEALAGLV